MAAKWGHWMTLNGGTECEGTECGGTDGGHRVWGHPAAESTHRRLGWHSRPSIGFPVSGDVSSPLASQSFRLHRS